MRDTKSKSHHGHGTKEIEKRWIQGGSKFGCIYINTLYAGIYEFTCILKVCMHADWGCTDHCLYMLDLYTQETIISCILVYIYLSLHIWQPIWTYCHGLSDYRRGLDWQLGLLDPNTVTVYRLQWTFTQGYTSQSSLATAPQLVFHCTLSSQLSLYSSRPRTSCRPTHSLRIVGSHSRPTSSLKTLQPQLTQLTRTSKSNLMSLYDRRSVGQSIMVLSLIWGSWPDINYMTAGLPYIAWDRS
jgi:hypothetical protein